MTMIGFRSVAMPRVRKTLIPARGRKPNVIGIQVEVKERVRKTLIPARGRKLGRGGFVHSTPTPGPKDPNPRKGTETP